MTALLANNCVALLASAVAAGDGAITLQSGQGAQFPSPAGSQWFPVTVAQATDSETFEIMRCTSRSGDTLTVTRAQEGTSALDFDAGDFVELRYTAGVHEEFKSASRVDAQTSFRDSTSGRALLVGAGGLLAARLSSGHTISDIDDVSGDLNKVIVGATTSSTAGAFPSGANKFGILWNYPYSDNAFIQEYFSHNDKASWFRRSTDGGATWESWIKVLNSNNLQDSTTDAAGGKILTTGAGGWLLNDQSTELPPSDDLDALRISGLWRFASSTTGKPSEPAGVVMHVIRLGTDSAHAHEQFAFVYGGSTVGGLKHRFMLNDGLWSPWLKIMQEDDAGWFNDAGASSVAVLDDSTRTGTYSYAEDDPSNPFSNGGGSVLVQRHASNFILQTAINALSSTKVATRRSGNGGSSWNAWNYLEQYKMATWTPALQDTGGGATGVSYAVQTGWYIERVNSVEVWFRIDLDGGSGGSGSVLLTGLPITIGSTPKSSDAAPCMWQTTNNYYGVLIDPRAGETRASFRAIAAAASNGFSNTLDAAEMVSGLSLRGHFTYLK